MRLDLAALVVATLPGINTHPSKQNLFGSEISERDEDISTIDLDSLKKSNLNTFAGPAYSNLKKKDFASDLQLAPVNSPKSTLLVAFGSGDEPCPDEAVNGDEEIHCPGKTKLMSPNPSGEDDIRPQQGQKPEPDSTPGRLPEKSVVPGSTPQVVSPVIPDGDSLLELLLPKTQLLPGDKKCVRPENSQHVCCEGQLGEIRGVGSSKYYRTIDNCSPLSLFFYLIFD
ncbi:hypothetical protein MMC07_009880 [Pseudocyphellaria aurata]|nr:hypothetical protein [Pseudocyphellaria aurata]